MKYIGRNNYSHASVEKVGLLVTNLGTPEAPTASALRKYLAEFLWDPRVVEYPRLLWWLILHLVILRIRPKRSAQTYAKIWTQEGSPLMAYTKAQVEAIKNKFAQQQLSHIEIEFAMRYGQPSIASALHKLHEKNVTKLEFYWTRFRDLTGRKIRDLYFDYIDLKNEAARENGYSDAAEMMTRHYETESFIQEIDKIWEGMEPLYKEIHAYARHKLLLQ